MEHIWYRKKFYSCAKEESIRMFQLPIFIVTFDDLTLEYGFIDL